MEITGNYQVITMGRNPLPFGVETPIFENGWLSGFGADVALFGAFSRLAEFNF
jgi:hypothetical protein